MSIIVLGTVALDSVKTPAGKRDDLLGGSAAHFAMSARLFTRVNLVAVVGEDFPLKHIDFLGAKGIVLTSLTRVPGGRTFRWGGEYKGDLNSALTLSTELGVLAGDKPSVHETQRSIKHIFLANVAPDVQLHLLSHMRGPQLIGLDSMNYWIKNERPNLLKVMKKADIYVANDQEARDLSGEMNLLKAAKHLRRLGPKMIVIKKGEHGVIFYCDKFIFALPAYPVEKVIDPTGAGDTFAGAFMGYLTKAKKINENVLRTAVAYGTVCASFNVTGFGLSRTSRLTLPQVNHRLKELKGLIAFSSAA